MKNTDNENTIGKIDIENWRNKKKGLERKKSELEAIWFKLSTQEKKYKNCWTDKKKKKKRKDDYIYYNICDHNFISNPDKLADK